MTLGFGTNDKLERAIRVLAPVLPADHVTEIPGKHDWETWRRIWKAWWAPGGLATRPPSDRGIDQKRPITLKP